MATNTYRNSTQDPLVLLVPGLNNSGPGHWQSEWKNRLPHCARVDLGLWDNPHRNTWVNKLNLAIRRADRPVVLVGHSLGCLAIAWWAEYELSCEGGRPMPDSPVIGALLVAPPDVEERAIDRRLTRFAPFPQNELPFRSILVASRNDPYMRIGDARRLARTWGASFADAGEVGHINTESGLGDWTFGRLLLNRLLPRPLALDGATLGHGEGAALGQGPVASFRPDHALRRLGA